MSTHTVYYHESPDGRIYVGQTTLPLHRRAKGNGSGYKFCKPMWEAIQSFGWIAFRHVVVATGLTAREADVMEQSLISTLDTVNPEYGFNTDYGGHATKIISEQSRKHMSKVKIGKPGVNLGKTFTAEHRSKLSVSHIRIRQSEETIRKRAKKQHKKVSQYSTSGALLQTFESLKEAAVSVGVCDTSITNACKGRYKTAGGFVWKYAD